MSIIMRVNSKAHFFEISVSAFMHACGWVGLWRKGVGARTCAICYSMPAAQIIRVLEVHELV